MSILFIIWLMALLVLGGTLVYAHFRMKRAHYILEVRVPSDFSEFLSLELHDIILCLRRMMHTARPHAKRATGYAVLVSRRGYDLFIERIFGRKEVTRGKTTSFFLKHISEEKEARGGGDDMPVQ